MGMGPAKERINKILVLSQTKFESSAKIEYNYKLDDNSDYLEEKKDDIEEENNKNNLLKEEMEKNINSPSLDIKKVNKYPYNSIGVISVKFSLSDEMYFYTCFSINKNIVVTLTSNLIDNNKGGKAISIQTSFSNEKVLWENIHIQDFGNDLKSKLATIIYEDEICEEWIGV